MASALLLVDVQKNMLEPPTPVPAAARVAAAIARLLGAARAGGAIIVHVRNNGSGDDPDAPGAPGHPVTLIRGAHTTYDGSSPAAVVEQQIEAELRAAGVRIANADDVAFA